MEGRKTIVLVLRSGGDFTFADVEIIVHHINSKWKSSIRPRIICLWDKASSSYTLGNLEIIPLKRYDWDSTMGTWTRIMLYSPEMEQYKPFLYVDLDTAVIDSMEKIFDLVKDESKFITLEDFYQKGQLATGLVWFPKNCQKTKKVFDEFVKPFGRRMDAYIRLVCKQPDLYWQQLTNSIYDFKPSSKQYLMEVPKDSILICFHGKPRIRESYIPWVKNYALQGLYPDCKAKTLVTVIIPYNKDRGWLQQAVNSVPKDVQLILSKGDGNWPENFNKALPQAEGKYIKYLHEDDMLTPNCIEDSVRALEEQGADFIHGNALEIYEGSSKTRVYLTTPPYPTLQDMAVKNTIHSATLMYRREVFDELGGFNESLNTAEEFEFNMRLLKAGKKIGYCNSILAIYRRHPKQKVVMVPEAEKRREREMVKAKYL